MLHVVLQYSYILISMSYEEYIHMYVYMQGAGTKDLHTCQQMRSRCLIARRELNREMVMHHKNVNLCTCTCTGVYSGMML